MSTITDILYDKLVELNDYSEIRISEKDVMDYRCSVIVTQTRDLRTGDWIITFSKIDRG